LVATQYLILIKKNIYLSLSLSSRVQKTCTVLVVGELTTPLAREVEEDDDPEEDGGGGT
jgi:hypothetical protein